ncbi:MAG: hypothetical protein LUF86_04540 [Clostridiales bacterium]|nr:hypothetical protein [Clostridiales bacterium]
MENKINIILNEFEKYDYSIIVHDAEIIDNDYNVIAPSFFKYRNSKNGLINNLIKNSYIGCCMAFKKELLKFILPIPHDVEMHDWWIGLLGELKGKNKFLDYKLIKYRRHDDNVSSLHHHTINIMISNRIKLIYHLLERINYK